MSIVTVDAPARSLEQRLDALRRANRVRSHRAQVKADIKAGRRRVGATLLKPEAELDRMRVIDLLLSTPKIGHVKANRLLSRARIAPSKTIGGLSPRQRLELVALIGRRG